jgi:hypothetical protein
MNRKQQSVLLAGLLSLVLAGCSSMKGSGTEAGSSGTGGPTGSSDSIGSGGTGSNASGANASGSSTGGTAATGGAESTGTSAMTGGAPNSVVLSIEAVPKMGNAAGSAAVGGTGVAGATGSSTGDEKSYKITLHMDDGSTRVVTQDKAPSFRSGDRVNMTDGQINQQ